MEKTGIWYIDYRPKSIDEIILPENVPEKVIRAIKNKDFTSLPHLLLIGSAGTGKTTLASVIVNEFNANVLSLNASDERGIDTIREKVKRFSSVSSDKPKIVFLDEADQLTRDAQEILRNIMENPSYIKNTRFILTGNYDRFIQPIKDRCMVIKFTSLPKNKILGRLKFILESENVEYQEEDVKIVIDVFYPSMRRMINFLQNNVQDGKLIVPENLEKVVSEEGILSEIFNLYLSFLKGNYKALYEIRKILIEKDFSDWVSLYRFFFDNVKTDIEKLIVYEWLYRHGSVADKEINFLGMLYALKNKAIPYYLVGNNASLQTQKSTYNDDKKVGVRKGGGSDHHSQSQSPKDRKLFDVR